MGNVLRGRFAAVVAWTLFVIPSAAFADFDIPSEPTLFAKRGGSTVTNAVTPELPSMNGSQLSDASSAWEIGFPGPWPHAVSVEHAVIGIFKGTLFERSFPLVVGENFSFAHAAIGPSIPSVNVSIPAPIFGNPATEAGTYTLIVAELPETKYVCQDVEPFDCLDEPYTDEDFIKYMTTDTSQPDAPFTYPPLGFRTIVFNYIAGEAPAGCTEHCFSSVVFVPGIKGSVLEQDGDPMWPPSFWSDDIPQLALDDNGESVNDIRVNGVLDEFCIGLFCTPIYSPFIQFLTGLVHDGVMAGWLPLAYDWRFGPERTLEGGVRTPDGTTDIIQSIEELASHSKSGKVTIVAHSMGGLMGKAIIKRLQQEGKDDLIDAFVMVGSPQLGTPQAVASLLHGDGEGLGFSLVVNPASSRAISQNMPSAYNLLPSQAYFAAVADPVVTFADAHFTQAWRNLWGDSITNYDDFLEFLTGQGVTRADPPDNFLNLPKVLRSDLMDYAGDFHATYDNYQIPSHIRVVQVAGWGRPTVKGVNYDTNHLLQSYNTTFTREGDGTVVYPSAVSSTGAETYFFNLDLFKDTENNQAQHRDLLNNTTLQGLVESVTRSENINSTNILSSMKPQVTNLEDQILVTTHSPVILKVQDQFGHVTGIDSNQDLTADVLHITEDIPGSSFVYTSESQNIFLPKNGIYTFIYKGTGSGPTTVNIDSFSGDTVTPVAQFSDIPTTGNTTASFTVTSAAPEETTITVDVDGDARVDETVLPDGVQPSLNNLIVLIKQKILALNVKDTLKQSLVKKIESLEKKIAAKKQKNEKLLANLKTKLTKQGMKGKIATGDVNELIGLIDQLEAQVEDISLDATILAQLKAKIVTLNIKASVKNDLLKRISNLENEQALTNAVANLTKIVLKKAGNGNIADTDAQMLIDLIGQIESAI